MGEVNFCSNYNAVFVLLSHFILLTIHFEMLITNLVPDVLFFVLIKEEEI